MKILMIGLGSIGQRHLRNIKRLYGSEHEIWAYRVRGLQRTFSDDMKIRDGVNLDEEFDIRVFSDLDMALDNHPDIVFVTNITSKHIECAIKAANAGCDIFLEKPVSDSLDGIEKLRQAVKKNNCILYVGYQTRFHPCIVKIKEALDIIGSIISVDNEFSERLVTMHTYEDYSKTYMARKEMGGGPILNLQIHALDYLQYLLGTPISVYTMAASSSGLDVDVEDCASSIYTFKASDGHEFSVYTHTDFLQYPPVHRIKIVGNKGRIEADLNQAFIKIIVNGEIAFEETYSDFARNDLFIRELQTFMKAVDMRKEPESNLEQGIIGLKMAVAAKKSAGEKRTISLEELDNE